ncbi:hypothetical protein ES708_30394 [subsurface metagenome]
MNEYLSNNKNYKPKNILILILIIIACIISSFSIWAEETETTPSLEQISEIINSYPDISSFQAGRLLKEAEEAIQSGISSEDTQEIIQKSLGKNIKAYSIIGIFSLLNELAEDGLPTSPIINKAKEGFAKGVSSDKIILSIREKSENLQFAKYLVEQSFLEEADIQEKSKAIEILASSFASNITEDMITDIFVEALHQKKDINEISSALNALSNLLDLDMSITSAKVITEDLLKEDYSPKGMMTLVNLIAYAKKKGLSVSEINSKIIARIREGEDALSIEKKLVDYLKDKEIAAKEDKPSSVTTTPSVGEEAVTPTQTTPEPPSEEVPPPEEPSSDEEVTTPTQTGGPDAP